MLKKSTASFRGGFLFVSHGRRAIVGAVVTQDNSIARQRARRRRRIVIVQGLVLGVKDGSYTSKKDGKQVAQLNVDVYDKHCGLVPCQIGGAGVAPPPEGTKIVADVTAIRKINFGVGYVLTIANIRPDEVLVAGGAPKGAAPR
jgi:hypothetical protein